MTNLLICHECHEKTFIVMCIIHYMYIIVYTYMYKAFFIDINFNQTPGKIVIIMICGGGVSAGSNT